MQNVLNKRMGILETFALDKDGHCERNMTFSAWLSGAAKRVGGKLGEAGEVIRSKCAAPKRNAVFAPYPGEKKMFRELYELTMEKMAREEG